MGTSRTFVVRVSDAPQRVVVEDVRERRRAVARALADVGPQIEAWLAMPAVDPLADVGAPAREDSVSGAP